MPQALDRGARACSLPRMTTMTALPETPSFRLDGRRALVTGAGRGIGLAAAAALAGQLRGRRAALIAACWAALDPSLVYYTRILHTEVLYTALLALAAALLVRYAAPGASWRPCA